MVEKNLISLVRMKIVIYSFIGLEKMSTHWFVVFRKCLISLHNWYVLRRTSPGKGSLVPRLGEVF